LAKIWLRVSEGCAAVILNPAFASAVPRHAHTSQKMEGRRHFENCTPQKLQTGSALSQFSQRLTEMHCVACQGTGHLRERMLYHHLAPCRHSEVLTDTPPSMAQLHIIGSVPRSKVEGGTGAGVKYVVGPDVLLIKLKRRAKIKKQSTAIRADMRNPSHSASA